LFDGTQEEIEIPTASGAATAVVLSYTSTDVRPVMPWDGVSDAIIGLLLQFAVWAPPAAREADLDTVAASLA
jgi:hypothetical protein